MNGTLEKMIQDGDWLGVAQAITQEHVESNSGDDRFADNISRAVGLYLDAHGLAEQLRIEEIEAERETQDCSSDSLNGAELNWAAGYGRGQ